MTFPNVTTYTVRINLHDFNGVFVEAKEVYITDTDLTDEQVAELNQILAQGTNMPVCENCGTAHPVHNVTVQADKKLCEACIALRSITAPERRRRKRRKGDRKREESL